MSVDVFIPTLRICLDYSADQPDRIPNFTAPSELVSKGPPSTAIAVIVVASVGMMVARGVFATTLEHATALIWPKRVERCNDTNIREQLNPPVDAKS